MSSRHRKCFGLNRSTIGTAALGGWVFSVAGLRLWGSLVANDGSGVVFSSSTHFSHFTLKRKRCLQRPYDLETALFQRMDRVRSFTTAVRLNGCRAIKGPPTSFPCLYGYPSWRSIPTDPLVFIDINFVHQRLLTHAPAVISK